MKKLFTKLAMALILFPLLQTAVAAQGMYHDSGAMAAKIASLAARYPLLCSVRSLVKTEGGKDIWVISIGTGNRDNKPAIAVFGGVEGNYILGRELALGSAEKLLAESSSKEILELLDRITFYILPDVSPDASQQFFSGLKYERTCNARSVDDDRDFVNDEDGYEDLNNDGLITLIRISDPSGTFVKCEEDERVMVQADVSKGEHGNYLVYSEGIDNDKDGSFNEDGPGGVDFNRNFTFNYETFGPGAGMYPVSEPETKAVADFLFDKYNIYAVLTFGPQDNLGQPWKAEAKTGRDGIIRSVMKEDEPLNRLLSEQYHKITGVSGAPDTENSRGNFVEWAYFHYGRYSFGTPAWWINTGNGKNREAAFLKYAETNNYGSVFVPWTRIDHPDFPGKITEVGGIRPFALINPPADSIENLISGNYSFVKALAVMHPELEFLDVTTENAGEGVFRISLKLHNRGIFGTCPKIGEDNMWTRIMRISVETSPDQKIISGQKVQATGRLEGGQATGFSWLIDGRGTVKIAAGALNTGIVTTIIVLK